MNNEEFLMQEYLLAQKIMRIEASRAEVGLYQGLASTNGNFKDKAQREVQILKILEENVEAAYEATHGKHLSYPEIRDEYFLIIQRLRENAATIEYPNEGLKNK